MFFCFFFFFSSRRRHTRLQGDWSSDVCSSDLGANSPYTTAVLSVAKQPNLPIEEAFKRVRIAVSQATDGRQIPWESSSLTTEFRFFGGDTGQPAATAPKSSSTAMRSVDDWRKDLQGKEPKVAYELVIADDSVAA